MRFSEKVAVVTGAGSGIGQATAVLLAREGAIVVGSDIDQAGLAATSAMLGEGASFSAWVSDVRSRDACHELVANAVDAHGRLDVLCNIAGVARGHRVGDVDQQTWDLIMGVNVDGVFWMSQAALPHLERSEGCIVNMASNAGLMGQAYTVPYCASKGAVVLITKAMAMETMKTGVRINAIAPGGVDTNLAAQFGFPDQPDMELMGRYMGFRGMSKPEDIAEAVAYVASDKGRRMHGTVLCIDAGMTAG